MRRKLVAGNWKMNKTCTEASAAVERLVLMLEFRPQVDVVVCPSFLSIPRVRDVLHRTHVRVGAQDVHWMSSGAFTGQVSPPMLQDCGVSHCIIGHSETRGRFGKLEISEGDVSYFAETDQTVNLKLKALLYHSITPILCVGETQGERDGGQTEAVIRAQLTGALDGLDASEVYELVVAYEPVWAIGTGNTCSSKEAARVCGAIRAMLAELLSPDAAESIRILYGGSVKSSNSRELFGQTDIDGGLVGGASLDPDEFSKIVATA